MNPSAAHVLCDYFLKSFVSKVICPPMLIQVINIEKLHAESKVSTDTDTESRKTVMLILCQYITELQCFAEFESNSFMAEMTCSRDFLSITISFLYTTKTYRMIDKVRYIPIYSSIHCEWTVIPIEV